MHEDEIVFSEELCRLMEEEANLAAEARACTGVLGIHPMSRDIKFDNFSVTFHGAELLQGSANSLKSSSVKPESELCYSLRPNLLLLDLQPSGLIDCTTPVFNIVYRVSFRHSFAQDTKLELSCGQRYGLIGANGSGKSSLLAVLGNREVPIQEHIDIYYLSRSVFYYSLVLSS